MTSAEGRYQDAVGVALEWLPPPHAPLTEADLAGLPEPVCRYVVASGAVGRPLPRSMRVTFDAEMVRSPGSRPLRATAVQVSTFDRMTRSFLMRSRMLGLPVRALHLYRDDEATFEVRLADRVGIVDQRGEGISRGETVTVLNDLCVLAPARLADPRLSWQAFDAATAGVTFTNGRWQVGATLRFERDRLVDFCSDDRPETVGKELVSRRWRTPLSDYRSFDGIRLAGHGDAVYERPEGPFIYGSFTMRSVAWD